MCGTHTREVPTCKARNVEDQVTLLKLDILSLEINVQSYIVMMVVHETAYLLTSSVLSQSVNMTSI